MNNKKLFLYGVLARLQKGAGIFIIIISILLLAVFQNWLYLISILFGGWMAFNGAAKEYDYKRQGGYIVYNG